MRLTIFIIIIALVIGISPISLAFLFNQENNEIVNKSIPYEKLEKYREDLEKINQYNQQILNDLEKKIAESDSIH